jgi:thiosulfate/3-mercaptopyruvate sulfurtransferase
MVPVQAGSLAEAASSGPTRPSAQPRARFAKAGNQSGERVVAHCGVGRSATPVYVAAQAFGIPVRLYEGSFEEWSRRTELPVERPEKK